MADVPRDALVMTEEVSKNHEFCIQNDGFCIENEKLCVKNEEFCFENGECLTDIRAASAANTLFHRGGGESK